MLGVCCLQAVFVVCTQALSRWFQILKSCQPFSTLMVFVGNGVFSFLHLPRLYEADLQCSLFQYYFNNASGCPKPRQVSPLFLNNKIMLISLTWPILAPRKVQCLGYRPHDNTEKSAKMLPLEDSCLLLRKRQRDSFATVKFDIGCHLQCPRALGICKWRTACNGR